MKKIILWPFKYTSEIFQSVDVKFSFLHKEGKDLYTQITNPVKCRDFLGDVLWSKEANKPVHIYGFQYDHKAHPKDEDMLRLSMKFPEEESYNFFVTNFKQLNAICVKAGTGKTKKYKSDQKLTLIIEADKVWQSSQWKLSLFTFYLKLLCYKDEKSLQSPENDYYTSLTPNNEKKLLQAVQKDIKYIHDNISHAHEYSGFVSVIKNYNKPLHAEIMEAQ